MIMLSRYNLNISILTGKVLELKRAKTKLPESQEVIDEETDDNDEPKYQENEINGKFRVTSEKWNDNLADPNSQQFKKLADTFKSGLYEMLAQERGLTDNADFKIEIIGFRSVLW